MNCVCDFFMVVKNRSRRFVTIIQRPADTGRHRDRVAFVKADLLAHARRAFGETQEDIAPRRIGDILRNPQIPAALVMQAITFLAHRHRPLFYECPNILFGISFFESEHIDYIKLII